ncbi:unnamed protein product [Nippostrongylus brasiliensis]|uniref:Transthyretin-like family protein n=1 Tax=Nippostrongylus brasiliensis TaxID=27835 RepID=A0A0N4YHM4_NIPBR|nr:unnamed protein product [Nippostrongylus brasiliensis]
MSRTAVFSVVIATVMAKHQNVTVEIGEITCGGDKYPDSLTLQIWDKDILNDDLLGEMYFNDTSCVRSRLNIPSDYVGGTYQNHQVELNSKFDDIKPC